jgi:cell wall-associated NlpC family hydrolase
LTQTGSAAAAPTPATPTTANPTADATAAPLTRRALREAEGRGTRTPVARTSEAPARTARAVQRTARPAQRTTSGVRRTGATTPLGVERTASTTATSSSRKRRFMAPVVLAVAAGMFGTMAVPAAFASTQATGASDAATAEQAVRADQSQQFDVSAAAGTADTSRDGYGATSTATLDAAKHSAEVEAARAAAAAQYASYQGKTAQQYLAAAKTTGTAATAGTAASTATAVAPNTPFSLPAVVATAKQYIGTPYVFGGATPAGFDCSGFVMFVYAQYGINLAHSVPLQDHAGTTIPESQAQPGDVVIFNSEAHDGFYMGNGMIMDAPKPGGSISIRPIWTSDYHIVRFGG